MCVPDLYKVLLSFLQPIKIDVLLPDLITMSLFVVKHKGELPPFVILPLDKTILSIKVLFVHLKLVLYMRFVVVNIEYVPYSNYVIDLSPLNSAGMH